MVFKLTGSDSRFQHKIGFEKYAQSPDISAKMCQVLLVWFGDLNFGTFWFISRDPVHIFQNRFVCWNREAKPVSLNTMKPYNPNNFFLSFIYYVQNWILWVRILVSYLHIYTFMNINFKFLRFSLYWTKMFTNHIVYSVVLLNLSLDGEYLY